MHTKVSRLRHHGNVAAAGLYPPIDKGDKAGREKYDSSEPQGLVKDSVHEIHRTEVGAYLRQLAGPPGVQRHELPTRRRFL